MSTIPCFKLYNGVNIPSMGLGTYGLNEVTTVSSIKASYETGATLIDTASAYNNEKFIGNAIKILNENNVLNREELFIETKVGDKLYEDGLPRGYYFFNASSCPCHDTKKVVNEQVEQSLKQLNTDYLDLLLIHWPYNDVLNDIWESMEELYEQKIIRAIGVSNFKVRHLMKIMKKAHYIPMVDQICISPINLLEEEYRFCIDNNILLEAYSPLNTLSNKKVKENHIDFYKLSDKYKKDISQILLRWFYQKGIITIPKSSKTDRVKMNSDIFDFSIDSADMSLINSLNIDFHYLVESRYCPGY